MSKTLVVTHVMPLELEMFERFISYYKNCFKYLDSNDDVTMYVTLNLNPKLTDWDNSELKQQWFIDRFTQSMSGIRSHLQIIVDDSLWGTTQQKREVLKLEYDYFIFVDPDIAVNEHQLKLQLMAAENVRERGSSFVISPNIPRWWDKTWDVLVHPEFLNEELQQFRKEEVWNSTFTQSPDKVEIVAFNKFKFGCGMHTLYSKEFWNDVGGIPEEWGGYGSEDTYAMIIADFLKDRQPIFQYILNGLYITEDRREENRLPSFHDKIQVFDIKSDGKKNSEKKMKEVCISYLNSIGYHVI
jgi:hypothetical protein